VKHEVNIFHYLYIAHILNFIQVSKSWDSRIVELLVEFPKIDVEQFNSGKKVLGYPE